ncbi:hypothetical protein EJO82_23960 [Salmonella enterica]|nr:hypothetical protein [Salmonella enterica]
MLLPLSQQTESHNINDQYSKQPGERIIGKHMIKDFNYGHGASFLFRLRRQHFTVAQRICTTAQCFHIYFGNAGR